MTMESVCKKDQCTGCNACLNACTHQAIHIEDGIYAYNAIINSNMCINCGTCRKVCPQMNKVDLSSPQNWYQGWVKDEELRKKSASGGYAYAIAKAFIQTGGIVAACIFDNGEFCFKLIEDMESLSRIRGSKYVKSDTRNIYSEIKHRLKADKVLFIGLPCQVAGLKSFIPVVLQERLYTVDLICHGSPSPKFLNGFLKHYKTDLRKIEDIQFRVKGSLNSDYVKITPNGVEDRYTFSFLKGLTYTENCYSCRYAGIKRCSDLTLGDSWGSELKQAEREKGISLAISQNSKGEELLNCADILRFEVDIDKAVAANKQLQAPYKRIPQRDRLIQGIKKGKTPYDIIGSCLRKTCFRQDIKGLLMKLHIIFSSPEAQHSVFSIFLKKAK